MVLNNDNQLWKKACLNRKCQRILGSCSAIFFALTLLSLFDGLQDRMRTGAEVLTLLPGIDLQISGPCPIKNPVRSDILINWSPEHAPVEFIFEGFFTGYWFGSGMWRGTLTALPGAKSGQYIFTLSFRGSPSKNIQKYYINLYDNTDEERENSLSFIFRFLGLNAFIIAASLGALALASGMGTYLFGMKYSNALRKLGLYEIYRIDIASKKIWCLIPKICLPKKGTRCKILNPEGEIIGTATTEDWHKGKLCLMIPDNINPSTNDLIDMK